MRVLASLFALAILIPGAAFGGQPKAPGHAPDTSVGARACRRSNSYLAGDSGLFYRERPLAPKKLTELPPATAYMAVMRNIGGCDAPLTMVEYRNAARR